IKSSLAMPGRLQEGHVGEYGYALAAQQLGQKRVAHVSLDEVESFYLVLRRLRIQADDVEARFCQQTLCQPPAPRSRDAGDEDHTLLIHRQLSLLPLVSAQQKKRGRRRRQPGSRAVPSAVTGLLPGKRLLVRRSLRGAARAPLLAQPGQLL